MGLAVVTQSLLREAFGIAGRFCTFNRQLRLT